MIIPLFTAVSLIAFEATPWTEAELDTAYGTCTAALSEHIEATGDDPVTFAPRSDVQMLNEAELIFAFAFGAISGADMDEAHPVTFVDKPVGSCLAYVGRDEFYRVIVNGAVVNEGPVAFVDPTDATD
ncbi:MAG: hypothetical protein AAFX09_08445 [Pseudomonadota bacterium]